VATVHTLVTTMVSKSRPLHPSTLFLPLFLSLWCLLLTTGCALALAEDTMEREPLHHHHHHNQPQEEEFGARISRPQVSRMIFIILQGGNSSGQTGSGRVSDHPHRSHHHPQAIGRRTHPIHPSYELEVGDHEAVESQPRHTDRRTDTNEVSTLVLQRKMDTSDLLPKRIRTPTLPLLIDETKHSKRSKAKTLIYRYHHFYPYPVPVPVPMASFDGRDPVLPTGSDTRSQFTSRDRSLEAPYRFRSQVRRKAYFSWL
jgi:hypothetical protein